MKRLKDIDAVNTYLCFRRQMDNEGGLLEKVRTFKSRLTFYPYTYTVCETRAPACKSP